MSCYPELTDNPRTISVIFFGERTIIDRAWYDAVMDLSRSNDKHPRLDLARHEQELEQRIQRNESHTSSYLEP